MATRGDDVPRINGASFKSPANPFPAKQCTWYAYGRAHETGWTLNFKQNSGRNGNVWYDWVTNAEKGNAPKVNSIMCMPAWSGNQYGHVAWVTAVADNDHWTIAQYNWVSLAYTVSSVTRVSGGVKMGGTKVYPLQGFLSKPGVIGPSAVKISESQAAGGQGQPGFWRYGPTKYWKETTAYGLDGHMFYTQNDTPAEGITNMADWRPDLSVEARYEVFVYIPSNFGTTRSARYEIYHSGGRTDVRLDQYSKSNVWVSLGTYRFPRGTAGCLRLIDVTDDSIKPARKFIAFDAAKWEPR